MSLYHWKKLSSEVKAENPWWTYRIDHFLGPKGQEITYHYMDDPGAVVIVGLTAQGKILLNKEYRPLFDEEQIEFPCGRIDEGQSPIQAARVEFGQEAGFTAHVFKEVGKFAISNGRSNARAHVFLASDLVEANEIQPDVTEEFEHFEMSPQEIDASIASGAIIDGITISAWTIAKPHILALLDQENHRG
ncbi:MAG: NUDIX hydrolase [Patescibacteria group bacterium]|jgi:ADP-ribose pyrophosphatase